MQPQPQSRRGFLSILSVGAAAVLTGGTANAAPPPKIGFGFSLYGMKSLKLSEALRICAEVGYSGVELACLKDWPCDPLLLKKGDRQALREQLNDLSLELPCLMENLGVLAPEPQHRENLERLKLACELGRDLSPDQVPLIETVLGGKPDEWATVRDRMVQRLLEWEKVAAAHQTVVAIKAHAFGALHTPKDSKWLVQQVKSPWIRLVFDYSHFQRQQFSLKESLDEMLAETVFVHVKDNIAVGDKTEFALPGDGGDIDYTEFLTLLRDGGYRGSVVVEVSGQVSNKPGYDPIAAARRCYRNLQPAFVKSGLRIET